MVVLLPLGPALASNAAAPRLGPWGSRPLMPPLAVLAIVLNRGQPLWAAKRGRPWPGPQGPLVIPPRRLLLAWRRPSCWVGLLIPAGEASSDLGLR